MPGIVNVKPSINNAGDGRLTGCLFVISQNLSHERPQHDAETLASMAVMLPQAETFGSYRR